MVDPQTQQCLKFLAAMAVEFAQTHTQAVQETLLQRIQASHAHLIGALTPREAPPDSKVPTSGVDPN